MKRTPLHRGKPLRRNLKPKRPLGDAEPEYLAWLRTRPCCVEGITCYGSVVPHHPRHDVGMGTKAPDRRAVPLCTKHHAELHEMRECFHAWSKESMRFWLDAKASMLRALYEGRSEP